MTSSIELFKAFENTKSLVAEYPEMQNAFADVAQLFDAKQDSSELSVMVYGIYNAGKSTLINALLGQEVAATGDVPLTAKVSAYKWANFTILDTPGVDAPAEHELVTIAQMMLADVIVFVVNPSGAAEEEKTLSKLIDLIKERKKVFLVFNEKNNLSQEDFIRLKNDIRARLQSLATSQGINEVLADIPVLRVNAARALKGKLAQQPGLIEHSGILELERELEQFFTAVTPADVNSRLANSLQVFLQGFIQQLEQVGDSDVVKKYRELCSRLAANQNQCRENISHEISRSKKHIVTRSKVAMHQNPQNCLTDIESLFEEAGEAVTAVIDEELQYLVSQFNDDVDTISSSFGVKGTAPKVSEIPVCNSSDAQHEEHHPEFDKAAFGEAAGNVVKMAKPEHIVSGLKLVKEWAPSLMKGIGPKTMEKWAGQVVGKWIPYAGTAVTVISSLYDLFSDDSTDKQAREHAENVKLERERFEREVDDQANELGEQFERSMKQIVRQELEPILKTMNEKVESALQLADECEKENSLALMRAQTLLTSF